ncbi:MAG: 50S ribosomal protein L13 [Candidatus Kapabacteria bacterium]|nr:50S ribosomal protein L13 [Candidatus Kapabacteria bacterium]MDW8012918.1 50S ribosomal protein L13 [Bacteroidota bacterium]
MALQPSGGITKSVRRDEVERRWWVVDAAGQTLGRLASQVARLLRGKHKPYFTPHVDCGDFVIVINAAQVRVEGKRWKYKEYFHYTGYPGGARFEKFTDLLRRKPEKVIEHAVWGMLPKGRLGRRIFRKLKVYAGPEHPHQAQQPQEYKLPYPCD